MSESIQCDEVRTRREQKEFLNLETELYQGDPNWVPPLWYDLKERVGFKSHPFYEDAQCQAFVVRRGSKVVGRVGAIINHAHNRRYVACS